MDGNDWDGEDQSFAGSHQQNYSGNPYSQNAFQQPQYSGQQAFPFFGHQGAQQPPFGQQQHQQYGGQHLQTGSQQQQQHFDTFIHQAQGGHSDLDIYSSQGRRYVPGQQQSQYGSQQARLQSVQNASLSFGPTTTWAPNQVNMGAPNAPQNLPYGLVETQQVPETLPREKFSQFPMAMQSSYGQQSSIEHTSRPFPSNSSNQQVLPRSRPLDGQSRPIVRQQHNMHHSQQIGHFQSQSNGGQRRHLGNNQQTSPLISQAQTGIQQQNQFVQSQLMPEQHQFSGDSQRFSPFTPRIQMGVLQNLAADALNMSSPQVQSIPQASTRSQHFSLSASQFQPGALQHLANNQPSLSAPQYQTQPHYTQGYLGINAPNLVPSGEMFHELSGDYHHPTGQVDTTSQLFGGMQQSAAASRQILNTVLDQDTEIEYEDGWYQDQAGEEGECREHNYCHRALHRTEQWLDFNTGEGQQADRPIPDDMVEDPLYQQTLLQVQEWQEQYMVPMTEEQQACLAVQETWKKKDNFKGGKRLAELDEDDLEDDIIEEAVRDAKRQRTRHEHLNFHMNAHKVYVQGPENRPELTEMDNGSHDDERVTGFDLDLEILGLTSDFKGEFSGETLSLAQNPFKKPYDHQIFDHNFRLIESICCDWTFMIEVTKHLRVKDIIMLYSVSKTFHNLVNLRFQSTIAAWAQEISPSGWKVFYWKFYGNLAMKDPAGKPWAMPGPVSIPRAPWAGPSRIVSRTHAVRSVPSLKYLAMISQRETRTRDILACLARAGHRLPETMHVTLKKMWMLMDIYTNNLRRGFIRNEDIWTPRDLYNAQMFYVKLQMRFNEPIFGPKSTVLADTFLGLRDGLNPLWRLLRRKDYLEGEQILQQRLKYYCRDSIVQHHLLIGSTFAGVHPYELGNEHKEGWGMGKVHLSRPDELVVEESVRRHLHMEKHIVFMMFWGHVDWKKRLNLVPTEEEMYMSDDELPPLPKTGKYAAHGMWGRCGNVPFEFDNWQPKHSMKARWKTLKREEKLAVIKDDEDEQMRALPFEKDVYEKFWDLPFNANDRDHPDYPGGEPANREQQEQEPDDFDLDTQMGEADDDDNDDSGSLDSFVTDEVSDDSERENREQAMDTDSAGVDEGNVIVQYEYMYEEESLPMPDTIDDDDIITKWDELDPYLQQKIIDDQERIDKQDEKDERTLAIIVNDEMEKLAKVEKEQKESEEAEIQQNGGSSASEGLSIAISPSPYTSPTKKQPKRYNYPGMTDPISLALLERYDRFAPEEFRTDENGNVLRIDQASSGSSSNTHLIELSDYDDYDDEDLKALADEEYDSDQIDFDLNSYQKFLERVGDDGGFRNPGAVDEGKDNAKSQAKPKPKSKKDVKGKGKAIAGESTDEENDYDRGEMAFEGDLDDDIPLPKYDFRKF